jgi:hypothetical protein
VAICAHAGTAVLCFPLRPAHKVNERINVVCRLKIHIAAPAAMTAVRAAFWDVFFPPETHTPVPAVAGLYLYFRFIYKHCNFLNTKLAGLL